MGVINQTDSPAVLPPRQKTGSHRNITVINTITHVDYFLVNTHVVTVIIAGSCLYNVTINYLER